MNECGYSFIKAAAVATDFENVFELKTVSLSSTVFRKATSFQTANKTLQAVSTFDAKRLFSSLNSLGYSLLDTQDDRNEL